MITLETFYSVLALFIGAGVFLVGIVMFSEHLGRNASRSASILFKKITDNRFIGYGVGFAVTAIVQSSAATTVTAVGLVNAGMLTLFQASSIMLGSHAGTTSTLFLVSLSTFDIRYVFMMLGFAGALIKIITKKENWINFANILISFTILFVGLSLMSGALTDNQALREFFIDLFLRIDFPPLLMLLGMVFTVILQSSTASLSLFLMMIMEGLMGFDSALFLGLGAIVGSSSTAILASITTNTNGRRAALLNFLFSIIGVSIFTCIIWFFRPIVIPFYQQLIPLVWQLPVFQLSYNLIAASVLIWFIKPLNNLVCRLLKEKEIPEAKTNAKKYMRTTYIDDALLATPAIALDLTKKEVRDMMDRARANLVLAFDALVNQDLTNKKKIKKAENRIDFLNARIAKYISKLSGTSISEDEDILLGSFCRVINDVERVGDYARKMLKDASRMKKTENKFAKKAVEHLRDMFAKVLELFDLSIEIFENRDSNKMKDIYSLDEEVDSLKSKISIGQIMWLKAGQYIQSGGEYFYSAVSDLERIADHLTNIAVSMSSCPGGQAEDMQEDDEEDDEESAPEDTILRVP